MEPTKTEVTLLHIITAHQYPNDMKNMLQLRKQQCSKLTDRELEVLKLQSLGLSRKMIAHRLDISPFTVNAHLAEIYRKYGVHSATQCQSLYNFLKYGIINFERDNPFLDYVKR